MVPNIVTLPQYFRGNGYVTATIGKMFDQRSVDKGMDIPSWSVPTGTYGKMSPEDYAKGYENPTNGYQSNETKAKLAKIEVDARARGLDGAELVEFLSKNRGPAVESADVPDDAYTDGIVAKKAVAMLSQFAKEKKRFFYAVGFVKPHLPFISPKKYWDLYDPAKIYVPAFQKLPAGAPEFVGHNNSELKSYADIANDGAIDDATARRLRHGYYAAISYMDAQVGLILDALEKEGLADNTVIVLWGDHGWQLGEHGLWHKHTNFELSARAPLLISMPGQKAAGRKSASLAEFIDIYPTLTELCGLPKQKDVEGVSLRPILDDPDAKVRPVAISTASCWPRMASKEISTPTLQFITN